MNNGQQVQGFMAHQSPIQRYIRLNNFNHLIQPSFSPSSPPVLTLQSPKYNLSQPTDDLLIHQLQTSKQPLKQPTPKATFKISLKEQLDRNIYREIGEDQIKEQQRQRYFNREVNGETKLFLNKIKALLVTQNKINVQNTTPKHQFIPHFQLASSIQKLHNDKLKYTQKQQKTQIQGMYKQLKQINNQFTITNPKTIFINQKNLSKQRKPFHQRSLQQKKRQKCHRQPQPMIPRPLAPQARMSLQQQQQFILRLTLKDKFKHQQKNNEKLNHLKSIVKEKPYVSKMSKQIFHKFIQKNQLQQDFVTRAQQYQLQKQRKQTQLRDKYQRQYMPFTPFISQNSREITKRIPNHQQRKYIKQLRRSASKHRQQNQEMEHLKLSLYQQNNIAEPSENYIKRSVSQKGIYQKALNQSYYQPSNGKLSNSTRINSARK